MQFKEAPLTSCAPEIWNLIGADMQSSRLAPPTLLLFCIVSTDHSFPYTVYNLRISEEAWPLFENLKCHITEACDLFVHLTLTFDILDKTLLCGCHIICFCCKFYACLALEVWVPYGAVIRLSEGESLNKQFWIVLMRCTDYLNYLSLALLPIYIQYVAIALTLFPFNNCPGILFHNVGLKWSAPTWIGVIDRRHEIISNSC